MNFKEYVENKEIGCMKLLSNVKVSENLDYHIKNKITLSENVFRIYSKAYFELINEVRSLYEEGLIEVNDEDAELLETNIGQKAEYNGKTVYLDAPRPIIKKLNEAEHQGKKVPLNKPMRTPGGPKKFKVYVKDGDRVKLVRFGDSKKSGLSIKNNSPARAKSFRARHKCSEKKDRTTAGYWSCNVSRYAKSLGLKSNRPW
jgi:hypothetical protein